MCWESITKTKIYTENTRKEIAQSELVLFLSKAEKYITLLQNTSSSINKLQNKLNIAIYFTGQIDNKFNNLINSWM